MLGTTFIIVDNATADYEQDWNLDVGEVGFIAIGQPSTEGVPYQKHDKAYATVDFGSNYGDVYIMKCNEHYKLEAGDPFKYGAAKENVTGKVKIEHVKQDYRDEVYCLVVDNSDNARPNDAVPPQYIDVSATFNWDDGHMTWFYYKFILIVVVVGGAIAAGSLIYVKKFA